MAKPKSTKLYALIKSMKPSEKRYFKVHNGSGNGLEGKKFIRLFELIDNMGHYDERVLEEQRDLITPGQLSNMKANLYKKILANLKNYWASSNHDILIREYINYAQLLFNKSLYDQCEEMIKKATNLARKTGNLELQLVALKWEKKIMFQTVKGDNRAKANAIISEVRKVNNRINNINVFTNIQLELNALYLKTGFIRNEADYQRVQKIFNDSIPPFRESALSLTEKSSLYSLLADYYIFIQDFKNACEYADKWVRLFATKRLISNNLETYIKALNSLMISQQRMHKYHEFTRTKRKLRQLRNLPAIHINENISLKLFKYTYVHEFNGLFMAGEFSKGILLMEKIKPKLDEYIHRLDGHSRLIMYYKIACLYVGGSDFAVALNWLNRIINSEQIDIREDIHGFARILLLICHYELGHMDVIDYYIRSTYRFLLKKKNLQQYQKNILSFLKKLNSSLTEAEMLDRFGRLRMKLIPLEQKSFEKRAFLYFDIISWLESKLQHVPVEQIIQKKAQILLQREVSA